MNTTGENKTVKYYVRSWRKEEKTIGFVPTMGALHEGHLDLVRKARETCDKVVVSIFVNPLQFNNPTDLEKYPRNLESDVEMLVKENVDLIYAPLATEFYPSPPNVSLDFGKVSSVLEGEMRPGHFSGVGIVVARLFHIVEPHKAFFGAKDLQQVAVIRNLINDLGFDIELVRCPTKRESSGLAMSSRNKRLSESGKKTAAEIFAGLQLAIAGFEEFGFEEAKKLARQHLEKYPEIKTEYLEWVNPENMEILSSTSQQKNPAICIAAWVEGIRLIDNLLSEN